MFSPNIPLHLVEAVGAELVLGTDPVDITSKRVDIEQAILTTDTAVATDDGVLLQRGDLDSKLSAPAVALARIFDAWGRTVELGHVVEVLREWGGLSGHVKEIQAL